MMEEYPSVKLRSLLLNLPTINAMYNLLSIFFPPVSRSIPLILLSHEELENLYAKALRIFWSAIAYRRRLG